MIPSVAVLLTCHNRKDKTLKCLSYLSRNNSANVNYSLTVYLVDDGSTDGTSAAVAENFPDVVVISGTGNLYWNRGMIKAWNRAVEGLHDFYLWLNDDTDLYENAIAEMLSCSALQSNRAIVVGVCESLDKKEVSYSGYLLNNKKRISPEATPVKCDYFNGNVVLVPHYVYSEIGMLDSRFTHALGDFEYGLRAKKANINAVITRQSVATCDRHDRLPTWCNPDVPLSRRYSVFYSPLGGVPDEVFYLEKKYFGLGTSIFHYFTIHLRLLLPALWKTLGKAEI